MASQNTTLHKRQSLGKEAVYNYRNDFSEGMDCRLLYRQGNGHRAALLDNLFRNKKKGLGGVESFPGYRKILTAFDGAGKLNGVFSHSFEGKAYLLLHVGASLYCVSEDKIETAPVPTYLGALQDAPSVGVSFGKSFYLCDGRDFIEVVSPDEIVILGDEAYTDEMADLGRLPETRAYIPLAWKNGAAYEDKNYLTAYYDIEDMTSDARRVYDDYGLKLRSVWYHDREALEVYGIESDRSALFVPNEIEYLGEVLPIVSVATEAFQNAKIRVAVISENVQRISSGDGRGAFSDCKHLEKVCLFGAEAIGSNAFAGCTALRELILPKSLTSIDATAFADCTSLERVYYEGEELSGSLYDFDDAVTVFLNTYLGRVKVGEEIRVAVDPDKYSSVYSVSEASSASLGSFKRFGGWSSGVFGDDQGYVTVAKSPIALCGICFDCHLASENDRYAFLTIEGKGAMFTEFEEPTAVYEIPIPKDCRALHSVTLDGKAATYKTVLRYENGKSHLSGIRFVFPKAEEKKVAIRVFSNGRDIGALSRQFPTYTGSADALVKSARVMTAKRDRLYLSGISSLDGAILMSSTPRREGMGLYFALGESKTVSRYEIHALHPCKERVAYLSEGEVGYVEKGVIASGMAAHRAISYRDEQYFLLSDGVYRLDEGVSVSYTHIERLSDAIREDGVDFRSARLAVWQGYLILLSGSRAYLADLDVSYREGGVTLHPWYRLSSLGDKANAPFCDLIALGEQLCFFTEDGGAYLVCENAEGYDGRRALSVVISEAHDMDCGYLYKKPCRKSFSLTGFATRGAITVSRAEMGEEFEKMSEVFFTKDEGAFETLPITGEEKRFLCESLKLSGEKMALSSVAFRYRVLKRRLK